MGNPNPVRRPPPEHSRWKKGQSGNPGGLPKKKPFTDAYQKFSAMPLEKIQRLDTNKLTAAEAVAVGMLREGMKGKPMAAVEAADRAEGKVKQTVEIEGDLASSFAAAAASLAEARGRR